MSLSAAVPDFIHAMSDAVVPAKFEVVAFAIAMLMYALLVSKRIPEKGSAPKKLQQDIEDPPTLKTSPSSDVKQKAPSPSSEVKQNARTDVGKKSVDVAKHIVTIRKCASAKDLKGAEAIFQTLKDAGAELDGMIYKAMIDACVACQNLSAAHAWLDQARRVGIIDVTSFNSILKAHVSNNDLDKARNIMREMKGLGMHPSVGTFNELISAGVKCGGKKDALWAMVDDMRQVGLSPNRVTCSIFLQDLGSGSSDAEIQSTMELIDAVREPMDESMLSSVVEACVRIGKKELLVDRLRKLRDGNQLLIKSSHTFGALIRAHGHACDTQGAWRQWKAMRTRRVRPTSMTLGCMVDALVKNGCTEDALELVQTMQTDATCKDVVNAVIYGLILKGFVGENKFERVWDVYQELEESHPEISHAKEIQACLMHT